MSQLQRIFDRTVKTKQEIKEINSMLKDAFLNSQSHCEIVEELKTLRAKKKKIEDSIKDDFSSEISKLDTLKVDLENDKMLMADAAMTKLAKGETVEVTDEKGNRHEPLFNVKFKRV